MGISKAYDILLRLREKCLYNGDNYTADAISVILKYVDDAIRIFSKF